MDTQVKVRATVQLREDPSERAQTVELLDSATPIQVLDDQGGWVKVTSGQRGAVEGWVPRAALIFSADDENLFPDCVLPSGRKIPSVPFSLSAGEFSAWLSAPGQPAWLASKSWDQLAADARQTVVDSIQGTVRARQADWDAWQNRLAAEGRTGTAMIDEWQCLAKNGMDVWSVRAERIFANPAEQSNAVVGWVVESDILRWTGQVKRNEKETKYKTWYEVSLYKQNKLLKGWFKGDLLDHYIFPTPDNDPAVAANADKQFDLDTPLLRRPADPEIADAITAKRGAYQYIDLFNVIGAHKIHHNLCGEFCAATLGGKDIIPFLNEWKVAYPKAMNILRNDVGTGFSDVKCMLEVCRVAYEEYRYSPSVSPISPARIRAELDKGRMAFAGVGIFKRNGKLAGTVTDPQRTTRHWVVLEDVIPVGNSGWVRIYNPFYNQEEVYPYNLFIQSHGQFPLGLWVTPP